MSKEETRILWCASLTFLCLVAFVALSSCGTYIDTGEDEHGHNVEVNRTGHVDKPTGGEVNENKVTWKEAKNDCFVSGCHNSSAPWIPDSEDDFKSSKKVKARVLNGTMPPSGYSKEKIKLFVEYLDSK